MNGEFAGVNDRSVSTETDDGLSVEETSSLVVAPSEEIPLVSLLVPTNSNNVLSIPLPVHAMSSKAEFGK